MPNLTPRMQVATSEPDTKNEAIRCGWLATPFLGQALAKRDLGATEQLAWGLWPGDFVMSARQVVMSSISRLIQECLPMNFT